MRYLAKHTSTCVDRYDTIHVDKTCTRIPSRCGTGYKHLPRGGMTVWLSLKCSYLLVA